MKVSEFNKLTSEIEIYDEQAKNDLKKIECLDQIKYIHENKIVEMMEHFLYDVFNGNLQVERKIADAPKELKASKVYWRRTEKIGVGSFFGTLHQYRKSINYFSNNHYLFKLVPEYLNLITNDKKREIIKEFIDWIKNYKKEMAELGFKKGVPLIYEIHPTNIIIPEPVNFYSVHSKHLSVVFDPYPIKEILLTVRYPEFDGSEGYGYNSSFDMFDMIVIIKDKNLCYYSQALRELYQPDYVLTPMPDSLNNISFRSLRSSPNTFTFTNLSSILNHDTIKVIMNTFYEKFKSLNESGNKLLMKYAGLKLFKGKI